MHDLKYWWSSSALVNFLETFSSDRKIRKQCGPYLPVIIRDMGIAGLNLKFNKKVKTNVERESIFIFKSHQTGPQFQKNYLQ